MSVLGLDASLIAPVWDVSGVEPHMEMLGEAGVRLLEVAAPRPRSFDGARARAFAQRWNVELMLATSLPPEIDPLEQPQDGLDFLESALRAAAEAGSPGLALPAPRQMPGGPQEPAARSLDALSRFLERAARLARPHDVPLVLRSSPRGTGRLVATAAQGAWLIERIGAENVRLSLDTAVMNGEEETFSRAFEAAAPFLLDVRAAESNRGVPGRGLLDWEAVLKALAETGWSGPLTVTAAPREGASDMPAPWRMAGARLEEMAEEGLPLIRDAARRAGLALG